MACYHTCISKDVNRMASDLKKTSNFFINYFFSFFFCKLMYKGKAMQKKDISDSFYLRCFAI